MSSAAPPPRKGAYLKHVQNLHKDQYTSTQLKNCQEIDLLDDILGYVKKRGAIEKQYAEAMLKLSNTYQSHRIAPIPDVNSVPTANGNNQQEQPVQIDMNVYSVWRFILEENEKLAKVRLATVHMVQDEIERDCKVIRNEKNSRTKKALEKFQAMQKDLQQTVSEVDRTKKNYFEDETKAVDVRDKATDAEDKAKGRKKDIVSFFQSSATLKRHAGKLSAKQEELDIRSTGARNDYILALASANAHQERYFKHDLQEILRLLEGDFYDKVSTYFDTLARSDLLTSSAIQVSNNNLRTLAGKISRGYNFRCYATVHSSLAEHVSYVQENVANDPITKITPSEHDGGYSLNYEARQCASRLNQAVKTVRAFNKRIKACHFHKSKGLKREPNDTGGPDLDTKIAELQAAIRNAEVERAKAEARLAKLREGGIAVDEYIDSSVYAVDQESQQEQEWKAINQETKPQQQRSMEINQEQQPGVNSTEDKDPFDEDFIEAVVENTVGWADNSGWENKKVNSNDNDNDNEVTGGNDWAQWNNNSQVSRQASKDSQNKYTSDAEIQPGNDWATDVQWSKSLSIEHQTSIDRGQPPVTYATATALFNFSSQNPDEVAISENEEVTILQGHCDEEGWLMAINSRGERGYVPENYIEIRNVQEPTSNSDNIGSFQHQDSIRSFGSVSSSSHQIIPGGVTTYSMDVIRELDPEPVLPPVPLGPPPCNSGSSEEGYNSSEEEDSMPPPGAAPSLARQSATSDSFKRPRPPSISQSFRTAGSVSIDSSIASGMTDFCKALYDYDATGSDEISFEEGDIIRVLKREPNGVDDGWWMGELKTGPHVGKSGLFPSIVVEECYDNGQDSQDDYSLASPLSEAAPPSFSPPSAPLALSALPDELEVPLDSTLPPPDEDHPQEREPVADAIVPSIQFDLVADMSRSSSEEPDSPDAQPLETEILVTAATPLAQSPVSEEDGEEKGDIEEMEKSVNCTIVGDPVPVFEPPLETTYLKNIDDTSSEEGVRIGVLPDGDDAGLKKSHYLERRSSSESSSDFSLGPRFGKAVNEAKVTFPAVERRTSEGSTASSSGSEEAPPIGVIDSDSDDAPSVTLAKAEESDPDIGLPPEQYAVKHLKKLERMKESTT